MSEFIQKFTNKKVEYQFDENINDLKKVGEIDLDLQMQSVEYTHLDELLNRFLPEEIIESTAYTSKNLGSSYDSSLVTKEKYLESASNFYTSLENLKEQNKVNPYTDYTELLKSFESLSKEYQEKVDSLTKELEVQKNKEQVAVEVVDNKEVQQ